MLTTLDLIFRRLFLVFCDLIEFLEISGFDNENNLFKKSSKNECIKVL